MATVQVCDGCGVTESDTESLGHVILRDYCGDCALVVQQAMLALDDAHENLALQWIQANDEIQTQWEKNHTGTLPDR